MTADHRCRTRCGRTWPARAARGELPSVGAVISLNPCFLPPHAPNTQVLKGHSEAVLALALTPTQLVSGSYDATLRFWDLGSGRCTRKCEGHGDAVRVLAAADGHVFSGSYDGTIGIW